MALQGAKCNLLTQRSTVCLTRRIATWDSLGGIFPPAPDMLVFDIIAGVASILGLLASAAAFFQARSATTAANQAKNAVLKRTLIEEMEIASNSMNQLLDLLRHDHVMEAGIRADDISLTLSELPFRRKPYLTDGTKNELLNAREQLTILAETLRKGQPSPLQKARNIKTVMETSMKLREELGKLKVESEKKS